MFSASRTSCLLKFYHRNLTKTSLKIINESSQSSWKQSTSICLTRNVQCSSSQLNSSSDDLDQIKKPRSIKKYFALDSFSSLSNDDDEAQSALDNAEISTHPKDDGLEASSSSAETSPMTPSSWNDVISVKYEQFDAKGSRIIYDITEQQLGLNVAPTEFEPVAAPVVPASEPIISLERGKSGVFDLEDLVHLLHSENGKDVVAMNIPAEMVFVDHMVVVSANSQRHLNAIAQTVRQYYNIKMSKKDRGLIMEGRDSPWVAMDLGNIALHVMSPSERRRIDLESLWLCGPEHDLKLQNVAKANQRAEEDDLFFLVDTDPSASANVDSEAYDITKEYDHPFIPVYEHDVLPDYSEINEKNINTYPATSVMEMALAKHNKEYARKYRGRFKK